MKGRKLLAAALLAGMVSSPVVMAEVLSDDVLDEVAAQGFQVATQRGGADVQNANNDAVQLNDNAQRNANGMAVTNSAASAANVGQNVAGVAIGSSERISQTSNQYAYNSESSQQDVTQEDSDVNYVSGTTLKDRQNANNGSAQLNDDAQRNVNGMAVTNAASSALNVGQNVVGVSQAGVGSVSQSNIQVAQNFPELSQTSSQSDDDLHYAETFDRDRQNANNGAVQANDRAQMKANGLALTNSAASAANVAQSVIGVAQGSVDGNIRQNNDQFAENSAALSMATSQSETNRIRRVKDRDRQNANNGSVQLNNKAQKNASGLVVTNVATSASNAAQNIVGISNASVKNITQSNKMVALNNSQNSQVADQGDLDRNGNAIRVDRDRQETNNGSIQMNNKAQRRASGLIVGNIASSAANEAQNIIGGVQSGVNGNIVQDNNQHAEDGSVNNQEGYQTHLDYVGFDVNKGKVNANNGAVQGNDNAQQNVTGLIITNAAGSALSVGQNIAGFSNSGLGALTQTNVQSSLNY